MVAHVQQHCPGHLGGVEVQEADAVFQPHIEVGVAVDDGGADLGNDAVLGADIAAGDAGLPGADEAGVGQGLPVIALAGGHGLTGLHDLILLHVHHGVHFHQAVITLQGHEIGGLVGDVQQQGEGGVIAHLLHLALGGFHGGGLRGAGDGVEMGLLRPLVGEDEADVGLVGGDGGDAGVHIHIVVDGDVVPAVGGQRHIPLAENGVEEAVVVHAVVVVLLHDDVGGVYPVHPTGDFFIVSALAGDGIHQNGALDVRAAEEADGLDDAGADPIGCARFVDLKHGLVKHHGGVVEPQVTVQVPAKVLGGGVFHALLQPDHISLLGHHVDDDIGRQALGAVGEPFDEVAVGQGGDPDGPALVVDLVVGGQDLELGHHVAELAQLPAAQPGGGAGVQHGDLVIGDLLDLRGEIAALNGQQLAVSAGPQHHPGGDGAHGDNGDQRDKSQKRHGALLFDKAHIALDAVSLKTGGQHGAHAVDGAHQEGKDVKLLRVEVDGRQLRIEIHQGKHQRHAQIDEGAGEGVADGLAGLAGPFGRRGVIGAAVGGIPLKSLEALEAAGVKMKRKRHEKAPFHSCGMQ